MESYSESPLYYLADGLWADAQANAGNKARADVESIFESMGLKRVELGEHPGGAEAGTSPAQKLARYVRHARYIARALGSLPAGAVVFVQFPLVRHTPLFARIMRREHARGIRFVLLLQDVEMLRFGMSGEVGAAERVRIALEEKTALRAADCIVVHNDSMSGRISELAGVPAERIVALGIFDYLCCPDVAGARGSMRRESIAVAGNLSRRKAGYLYSDLGTLPLRLYGMGYESAPSDSVEYCGAVPPDELPGVISGSFGLVWDGPSAKTCEGGFGGYHRVNKPHQTSHYLAAGLPVLIWDEAALAPFIADEGAGILVSSLDEIAPAIDGLSDDEYAAMRGRAAAIGSRLRAGFYTRRAVERALEILKMGSGRS